MRHATGMRCDSLEIFSHCFYDPGWYKSYSVIDIQPSMGHTVITNRCARPVALTKVVAARARSTKLLGLGTTAVVAENEHCRVAPLN